MDSHTITQDTNLDALFDVALDNGDRALLNAISAERRRRAEAANDARNDAMRAEYTRREEYLARLRSRSTN